MSTTWNPDALSGMRLGTCILEEPLSIGGMGAVFLARQERPHRHVAVKVIHRQLANDPDAWKLFLARFQREADATASLDHANIVPIYEFGEMGDIAYLVMPYLPDGSLATLIEQGGPLPLQQAVQYIEQVAAALDYAHSQGIVHRDVKPSNMLLHPDGRVLLADFGIARPLDLPDLLAKSPSGALLHPGNTALTQAGSSMGTPEFMAPEQVRGGAITPATDIYALGIASYEMLMGQTPFGGGDVTTVLRRQLVSPPPPLRTARSDIPARAEEVVFWALAKDPHDRPSTAGEYAKALRAATRNRTLGALGGAAAWLRPQPSSQASLAAPSAPLGPLGPASPVAMREAASDPRFPTPTMPLPQGVLPRSRPTLTGSDDSATNAVSAADAADRTITVGAGGVAVQSPGWETQTEAGGYGGAGGGGAPQWPAPQPRGPNKKLAIGAVAGLLMGIVAIIIIAALAVNTVQSVLGTSGTPGTVTNTQHTVTPLPTATRVPPTATPTPVTNWLVVSPTSIALSCRSKSSATLRLTNEGPESVDWQAQVQNEQGGFGAGISITPMSGSLDSGQSVRITVRNTATFFGHQGDIVFSVVSGQQAGTPADVTYSVSCGGGG